RRIASSRVRELARSRSNPPTFTHAMTSNRITAALSAMSAGRMSPTIASVNDFTLAPLMPLAVRQDAIGFRLMIETNSLAAAEAVAPGARRAMAIVLKPVLPVSGDGHGSQ